MSWTTSPFSVHPKSDDDQECLLDALRLIVGDEIGPRSRCLCPGNEGTTRAHRSESRGIATEAQERTLEVAYCHWIAIVVDDVGFPSTALVRNTERTRYQSQRFRVICRTEAPHFRTQHNSISCMEVKRPAGENQRVGFLTYDCPSRQSSNATLSVDRAP